MFILIFLDPSWNMCPVFTCQFLNTSSLFLFEVILRLKSYKIFSGNALFTGQTALLHAVLDGHYLTAAYVLEQGADPDAAANSGYTPLHHAAEKGFYISCKSGLFLIFFGLFLYLLIAIVKFLTLTSYPRIGIET